MSTKAVILIVAILAVGLFALTVFTQSEATRGKNEACHDTNTIRIRNNLDPKDC